VGGELAYLSVVLYALVASSASSATLQGIGKFAQPFFPWGFSPETYGTVILLVTGLYCVVGGMYSVVMNDLIQFGLILSPHLIGVIAMVQTTRSRSGQGAGRLGQTCSSAGVSTSTGKTSSRTSTTSFTIDRQAAMAIRFRFLDSHAVREGVLVSMAGPTPNYASSTCSPPAARARRRSRTWSCASCRPALPAYRGIAVIGLVFFQPADLHGNRRTAARCGWTSRGSCPSGERLPASAARG